MQTPDTSAIGARRTHKAIVVGAGITGLAVSRYLGEHGIEHVVLERAADLGGIWRSERWPGVRCDTEIVSYSYGFRPLVADRPLVSGAVILRYLEDVARACGTLDRIRFGTTVHRASFDDRSGLWLVDTSRGRFATKFLINANGYFADEPYLPRIPGVEDFRGAVVHLSRLSAAADLAGRRVILVGSGAAAVSAAPALCARCDSVTLLQRSPSYIFEDPNELGPFSRLARRLQAAGLAWPIALVRFGNRIKNDLIFLTFRRFPGAGKAFFRRHWRRSLDAETFDESFQPRYDPWEQRIPVAVGLRESLRSGKLRIVTGRIDRFTETAVVLRGGRRVAGDLCVLATGHDLDLFKFPLFRGGRRIETAGINFYKGMMLGGVPNYFHPFGVVHATWTQRIERVAKLITKIVLYVERRRFATVAVDRKPVPQRPRITPNYIMRSLPSLPAMYGTLELPSVDDWLCFAFRRRDYRFSRTRGGDA